jgi:hypothetical protein
VLATSVLTLNCAHAQFVDERTPPPSAKPAGAALPGAARAAAAPSVPPPAPPPPPMPKWMVSIGDVNLQSTFERWAQQAGYRVKWDAGRHVLVDAPGEIEGSFEQAVETVLASPGIRQSEYPLEVCFYSNKVARVTRRGEQQKECR